MSTSGCFRLTSFIRCSNLSCGTSAKNASFKPRHHDVNEEKAGADLPRRQGPRRRGPADAVGEQPFGHDAGPDRRPRSGDDVEAFGRPLVVAGSALRLWATDGLSSRCFLSHAAQTLIL